MTASSPTRIWYGHSFHKVTDLSPERDALGRIVELTPHLRYAHAERAQLNLHGTGPFCRFRIPTNRMMAGIYIIAKTDGRAMYVGECTNLSERFNSRGYGSVSPANCYVGGQSTNCRINALILAAAHHGEQLTLWFLPTTTVNHSDDRATTVLFGLGACRQGKDRRISKWRLS